MVISASRKPAASRPAASLINDATLHDCSRVTEPIPAPSPMRGSCSILPRLALTNRLDICVGSAGGACRERHPSPSHPSNDSKKIHSAEWHLLENGKMIKSGSCSRPTHDLQSTTLVWGCFLGGLRLGCNLSKRLRRTLNSKRSWREPSEDHCPPNFRFRLRSWTSPHNRSRANPERGAKQRPPRRPHEEYRDKRQHQQRFPKPRFRAALIVDVEQQCEEGSHFHTLASSTPKHMPNRRNPPAATKPTATQRRTADRE